MHEWLKKKKWLKKTSILARSKLGTFSQVNSHKCNLGVVSACQGALPLGARILLRSSHFTQFSNGVTVLLIRLLFDILKCFDLLYNSNNDFILKKKSIMGKGRVPPWWQYLLSPTLRIYHCK